MLPFSSESHSVSISTLGRFLPVTILAPEGLLLAVSCHWLSDGVNSRYALESSRSPDVDFNKLKDRKRPAADIPVTLDSTEPRGCFDPKQRSNYYP